MRSSPAVESDAIQREQHVRGRKRTREQAGLVSRRSRGALASRGKKSKRRGAVRPRVEQEDESEGLSDDSVPEDYEDLVQTKVRELSAIGKAAKNKLQVCCMICLIPITADTISRK